MGKLVCSLLLSASAFAQAPSLIGVSLHDTKMAVQSKLKPHATFQREEEGQQIWHMTEGPIENLIVGYDAEHRVRYVTALGTRVPCESLGATPKTTGKAPDLIFQRDLPNLLVVAHGPDLSHLASCSLKDPHSGMTDPDEEERQRR